MKSKELRELMLKYDIDSLHGDISSCSFAFYLPLWKQEEIRLSAIKKAFNLHYSLNKFYRSLCDKEGFTPLSLKEHEDLTKIPLIPSDYFIDERMEEIMTLPSLYKQIEFHETGLRGEHTKVYRDSYTNDMAIMTIASLFTEMLDTRFNPSPIVVFFTPPIISAPNLGMLRGMSILGAIYADRYYVIDESNEFRFRETTDYINQWLNKLPIYLVGPPFILKYYLEYLKANKINLKLGDTGRIITIGGWKKADGKIILKDDFIDICQKWFSINRGQIRDIYGFIETNLMSIECKFNIKHVPTHVYTYAKSLNDNTICESNQEGCICVLDPTIMTYPCFVKARDVGIVHKQHQCDCGRNGLTIELLGKIDKNIEMSCAITLDQYLSGITDKINYGYS